jgi:hypothetical protein
MGCFAVFVFFATLVVQKPRVKRIATAMARTAIARVIS